MIDLADLRAECERMCLQYRNADPRVATLARHALRMLDAAEAAIETLTTDRAGHQAEIVRLRGALEEREALRGELTQIKQFLHMRGPTEIGEVAQEVEALLDEFQRLRAEHKRNPN